MRNKRAILVTAALCAGIFCGGRAWGDNITVSNAKLADPVKGTHGTVRFNVQWEHSWRLDLPGTNRAEPYNYDAAWVFVKYRAGNGEWKHATLSTNAADHVVPSGCALSVGQTDGKGVGVFLYRSANGTGTFTVENVGLRWEYPSNWLNDSAAVTVKVFAIEMVYVTQGPFWVGDGMTNFGQFYEGDAAHPPPPLPPSTRSPQTYPELSSQNGDAPEPREATLLDEAKPVDAKPAPVYSYDYHPFRIVNENALAVGDSAEQLFYNKRIFTSTNGAGDGLGPIPVAFPKGYAAFYGMKYEITQGQYVDFLNTLPVVQARNRQHSGDYPFRYSIIDVGVGRVYPPYSQVVADTLPDAPAVADDPNAEACGKYVTHLPYVACNWFTWFDLLAYLDWAGLRPMTELEYEKACRGPLKPVAGEYAWGNTNIVPVTNLINIGQANEAPGNPDANCDVEGAMRWRPIRVGCMGMGTGDRTRMGAGYYGMLDLTGNNWERVVSVGNAIGRSFTGLHGDGVLSDITGDANVPAWPLTEGVGQGPGSRGGGGGYAREMASVSHRRAANNGAVDSKSYGFRWYWKWGGGRGVRTSP